MEKFRIGQTTGRKFDAEMVAQEMQGGQNPNDMCLFKAFFAAA